MNKKVFINIILVVIVVALVGTGAYFVTTRRLTPPTPTSTSPPKPSPTPTTLSPIELKYRLEGKFGKATFCGPPVVYSGYEDELLKQFPTVSANIQEFTIILRHLNIADDGSWTDQEKLTIINEYNRLSVISLEPSNSNYRFTIRSRSQDKREFIYEGLITQSGSITTTKQEAYLYGCPICLAGNTLIDTPTGQIPVEKIQKGMLVWTADEYGNRLPATVLEVSKVPVPTTHRVVHLVLYDGRELYASQQHPTKDGRTVGEISIGDTLDSARVVSINLVSYSHGFTYDLFPSGETGLYWANGILLRSSIVVDQ